MKKKKKKKKEKRSSSKAQPLVPSYFPEEIITDILLRLPVKTLIKFRSVSKSWLYLISNPNFINTHLLKSITFYQQKVALLRQTIIDHPRKDLKTYSLHSLFHPPSGNFIDAHPPQSYYLYKNIVGSCNGLLCIVLDNMVLFIWNPSTRQSKKLPLLDKSAYGNASNCFGFGYDKLSDAYKVVFIEVVTRVRRCAIKAVKVYSLKTNSWRQIGDWPSDIPHPSMGKFVNGALHWIVRDTTTPSCSYTIVSLDLGNETYGEIMQPTYGVGSSYCYLAVLEGCLSVCSNYFDERADIWVMKEYRVRGSWVKLYTIPYYEFPRRDGYLRDVLFCDSVTGEIVLKFGDVLVSYHPNYGTFRNETISTLDATAYVESLVWP